MIVVDQKHQGRTIDAYRDLDLVTRINGHVMFESPFGSRVLEFSFPNATMTSFRSSSYTVNLVLYRRQRGLISLLER